MSDSKRLFCDGCAHVTLLPRLEVKGCTWYPLPDGWWHDFYGMWLCPECQPQAVLRMNHMAETDRHNADDAPLCMSKGPRIGSEGSPYCKLPEGHDDLRHRPDPEDGWGPGMTWIDPWDPRLQSGSSQGVENVADHDDTNMTPAEFEAVFDQGVPVEVDAPMYVWVVDSRQMSVEQIELGRGVVVDIGVDGLPLGVEFLGIHKIEGK